MSTRTDFSQIFDIITMVIIGVLGLGVCFCHQLISIDRAY